MPTSYPAVSPEPGVTRQVMSDHPDLMVVSFRFETGAVGSLHSHPQIQATYVLKGRFRMSVDGKEREVGPGESLVVPSNVVHGCQCLEAGELIDTFTPRRDEFL